MSTHEDDRKKTINEEGESESSDDSSTKNEFISELLNVGGINIVDPPAAPPTTDATGVVTGQGADQQTLPPRIKTRRSEVLPATTANPSDFIEIRMLQLKHKVMTLYDIQRELTQSHSSDNPLSFEELEGQEKIVEMEWTDLLNIQEKIIDFIPSTHEYVVLNTFERAATTRRNCIKLIYQLKSLNKKRETESTSTDQSQGNQLRRIELRTFDGQFSKWAEFKDFFNSLVGNNPNIPPVQKLVRLKEALRGPAASLISTFTVTDENYEKAWKKLTKRYEDPRLIAQALFNRVLTLPKITQPTSEQLNSNVAVVEETLDQLTVMTGLAKDNLIEQMFTHLLRKSLDTETLRAWELKLGDSKDFPTLDEFGRFVESCARGLNAGAKLHSTTQSAAKRPSTTPSKRSANVAATQPSDGSSSTLPRDNCALCKGQHFVDKCQKFLDLTPIKRNDFAAQNRLCFNCLGPHNFNKCTSKKTCFKCKRKHHTLIHGGSHYTADRASDKERRPSTSGDAPDIAHEKKSRSSTKAENLNNQQINEDAGKIMEKIQQTEPVNDKVHHVAADQQLVLLATAQILAQAPKGFSIKARALIDQGSELSFISDRLVHQLRLQRRSSTIELIGIGGTNSGHTRGVVTVTLRAVEGAEQVQFNAHILQKLTARLPSFSCSAERIGKLQDLQLADPDYLTPGPIEIIIGADNYGRIIKNHVVKSEDSQLVGQHTIFGWILSGPIRGKDCSTRISLTAVKRSSNEQLLELLQKFWVQEELPEQRKSTAERSTADNECEIHFKSTHSRDETGRYIVRLPLRVSTAALGDSKFKASRQLQSVVRRLKAEPAYSKLYTEFINEYEALGHMREASEAPEPTPAYYLPHHGVLRADAITTKLRVVFNGSSQSSTGVSLNDLLYPGEKLQVDAMEVLTWLRRHKLVFGTDIVKMFRQIRVHKDDWDLQRILWSNEKKQQITYQLTTVTYGLNCSPWLSLRVLQQVAEDEGHRFPAAVETLTKGRYVDDIYGGAESEKQLQDIAIQLQGLCSAGGFELQKWSSNCPRALQELGLATDDQLIQFEESIVKVLGLCWQQSTDTFRYKSKDFNSKTFTKRSVLSEIAQIFDPLGFISPVIVRGKIFIQDLWRLKLNWDDPLPLEYVRQWKIFRQHINELDEISVPRWLKLSSENINIQIHGFSDASAAAMSAVVYIRTQRINEPASSVMVCAKTKVAPLKHMTIPRLELTAAVLLTQLVASTYQMLDLDQPETYLWSDSSVALAWIRSEATRWKEFVHNRVIKIQEALPKATWRHVSGKENPADCASRGISPSQLAEHQLWWSGPEWLNQEPAKWPKSTIDTPAEVSTEAKPSATHQVAIRVHALAELLERYSTLSKVLQVTSTLNRAIERFRRRETPQTPILTQRELNESRLFWVKITQMQYFAAAHRILQRDNQLPRNHQLAKLTPTLDDEDIIRLGGRLKNSLLDADEIHPIVLPRQSRFTTLVIEEAHRLTLHGGTQLTLAHTRQKYWIIGGRSTVRAYIQRCAICARHRAKQAQQRMGQLPSTRISPARAFLHTGVDYAGPFPILKWRPTNAQPGAVHIAVFVCFTTSAVHLELVTRQTTEAFIAAYKRFTGRRGIPEVIYSDNATTFDGASRILNNLYQQRSEENHQIQGALATMGTQWSFSPPRSPHFGGKWEAAVKSTKYHLKRVLGSTTATYEELNTILIQIEACLNSRPLAPLSDDPDDLQALTPGHFLIGEPLKLIPEPSLLDENSNKMQRWNLITQKIQQFWDRWSKECLQKYQAMYKWTSRHENINVGDMVLMIESNYPPAEWPIARVIAVHPGADGLTRVATVKTAKANVPSRADGTPNAENITTTYSVFKRAITKLCRLPTDPPPPEDPPGEDINDEEENQQQ